MDSTTLSSKGQIIIPKSVREAMKWPPGTVFNVLARDGGVLLVPEPVFAPTQTQQVAGCLKQPAGSKVAVDEALSLRQRALMEDRATKP